MAQKILEEKAKPSELLREIQSQCSGHADEFSRRVWSLAEQASAELARPCVWTFSDANDADIWESACGESWVFIDGGPPENHARFCHGCGRSILQAHGEAW